MKNKERFDLGGLMIKEAMSDEEAYAKVLELQKNGMSADTKKHPSLDECLMSIIKKGQVPSHMSPGVIERYFALKKQYGVSKKGRNKGMRCLLCAIGM